MPEATTAGTRLVTTANRLYAPFRTLVHEIAKFGIIGMISLVIDVGLFNLLLFGGGPLTNKPITAKIVSVAVATTFAYFGNRFWTCRPGWASWAAGSWRG